MKDIILKAENIFKQYRLGQVGTVACLERSRKAQPRPEPFCPDSYREHQVRGKENPYLKIGDPSPDNYRDELAKHTNDRSTKGESDYVWALQDINFEIGKKVLNTRRAVFREKNII